MADDKAMSAGEVHCCRNFCSLVLIILVGLSVTLITVGAMMKHRTITATDHGTAWVQWDSSECAAEADTHPPDKHICCSPPSIYETARDRCTLCAANYTRCDDQLGMCCPFGSVCLPGAGTTESGAPQGLCILLRGNDGTPQFLARAASDPTHDSLGPPGRRGVARDSVVALILFGVFAMIAALFVYGYVAWLHGLHRAHVRSQRRSAAVVPPLVQLAAVAPSTPPSVTAPPSASQSRVAHGNAATARMPQFHI